MIPDECMAYIMAHVEEDYGQQATDADFNYTFKFKNGKVSIWIENDEDGRGIRVNINDGPIVTDFQGIDLSVFSGEDDDEEK